MLEGPNKNIFFVRTHSTGIKVRDYSVCISLHYTSSHIFSCCLFLPSFTASCFDLF